MLLLLLLFLLPPNDDFFEKESTKSEEEEREEAMIFSRFVLFSLLFVLSLLVLFVCLKRDLSYDEVFLLFVCFSLKRKKKDSSVILHFFS